MEIELKKRVKTGIFGGMALLLLVSLGGSIGAFLFATALSLFMVSEYSAMVYRLSDRNEKTYALVCVAWFNALANFILPRVEFEIVVCSFFILFVYFLGTAKRFPHQLRDHFIEFSLSVLGLVYLAYLPFFFPKIHALEEGVKWVVLFLLIVFANDTGGYFAGKKYGRTPLYPLISPKKTREGACGGVLAGYAVTFLAKLVWFSNLSWAGVLLVPGIIGLFSQIGDLCESLVKRAFDIKDSGKVLPGHGGLMDRFDGVVFTLPVMYVLARLFNS